MIHKPEKTYLVSAEVFDETVRLKPLHVLLPIFSALVGVFVARLVIGALT